MKFFETLLSTLVITPGDRNIFHIHTMKINAFSFRDTENF